MKNTNDNLFKYVKIHERYKFFFLNRFSTEIDYISSHFFELCEKQEGEFENLSIDTLFQIMTNDILELNTEDQLLKFVKYSILYEAVLFENASSELMNEFISVFDKEETTAETLKGLSKPLLKKIESKKKRKVK